MIRSSRHLLRHLALDILSLKGEISTGVHLLNGHYIGVNNLPDSIFASLLTQIKKEAQLINFDEATKIIVTGKIPKKEKLVAFTFDDGFEECFLKIRPVLKAEGIKAGFFINTGFIDGNKDYKTNFLKTKVKLPTIKEPMTWEQIITLKSEGHIIGAHTIDHDRLVGIDYNKLYHQIVGCKKRIEEKLEEPCNYFAYPYGQLEDIVSEGRKLASQHFLYNFTQTNSKDYFSFKDYPFINRRHFEGNWKFNHVKYFLKRNLLK
ncbi:MAG: polysaccharide deacetylase family protein [Bacteroidetes bacterium]|nr:polysaccharide deacetylase family protein [Bacteroidota bacterium]MBS1739499.1 polysaccharide deacetylase family protein [Bacteroidota bacterium]